MTTTTKIPTPSISKSAPTPRARILLFDHTAALGGGEIALLNLVRELLKSNYDIQVLLASDGDLVKKFEAIGIAPHILPLDPAVVHTRKDSLNAAGLLKFKQVFSSLGYARRLAHFLQEHKIDLLHTNSLKSDFIGAIAARRAGIPCLWHVRDRICREYLPRTAVHAFRFASRLLPTAVVVNSQATLDTLPKTRNQFIAHDGVESMPSLPTLSPLPSPLSPVIGIVGRISPWKGQHVFLQAAAEVLKTHPKAKFQIVGSALFSEHGYEEELHALVQSLNIADAVEFTGFRSDVANLVARMDIVVHASTIGEPFGQVVIEAMSAAKPVIATRGGGIPEIIEDKKTGLLIPMNTPLALTHAITTLLGNPALAKEIATAARDRVADYFLIQHHAQKILKIYDTLLPLK